MQAQANGLGSDYRREAAAPTGAALIGVFGPGNNGMEHAIAPTRQAFAGTDGVAVLDHCDDVSRNGRLYPWERQQQESITGRWR